MTRGAKIVALAAAAALATGAAVAAPRWHGGGPARGGPGVGMLHRIADRLDLTQAQRQEIRAVVAARWNEGLGDATKSAREARRGLQDALSDPAADEARVREAARRTAWAMENLAVERHKTFAKALAILTPEQQAKAREMRARFRERADRRFAAADDRLRED